MEHSADCETRLECALSERASWPIQGDLASDPVEINGGLTNRSFLLSIGKSKYRLRLNTQLATSLGIDREREAKILERVQAAGLGPRLLFTGENFTYSVFEYVEGQPWTGADYQDPKQIMRLEQLIAQFQEIKLDSKPRDYRVYLNHYWQQLQKLDCLSEDEIEQYNVFESLLEQEAKHWPAFVLCHHDLIPENIIETAQGLNIIDWEYAAIGHPGLDRQCIASYNNASNSIHESEPTLAQLIYWLNRLWHKLSIELTELKS